MRAAPGSTGYTAHGSRALISHAGRPPAVCPVTPPPLLPGQEFGEQLPPLLGGPGPRVVQLPQRLGQHVEDLADPVDVPGRRELAHPSTRGRHCP